MKTWLVWLANWFFWAYHSIVEWVCGMVYGMVYVGTNYSKVDTGLYVGGCMHAVPDGVKVVFDFREAADELDGLELVGSVWLPIPDGEFPGIQWLDMTVDLVTAFCSRGVPVLLHCTSGVSRSGMVATAFEMRTRHLGRDAALEMVRRGRPVVTPNPEFMLGLLQYEHWLKGRTE